MNKGIVAEEVASQGKVVAMILRDSSRPDQTTFLTSNDQNFQLGFVVYPGGGEVVPHLHKPVVREVVGTSELIIVKEGRVIVDIYSEERELISSKELGPGDAVLQLSGGHGFRMLEDTILFEVKQGPYSGVEEKERFKPGES